MSKITYIFKWIFTKKLSDLPNINYILISCLEKKIEQILADPPDRKKIYQLSKTKFSSDVMAENYVKFYKELVNGKHEINI